MLSPSLRALTYAEEPDHLLILPQSLADYYTNSYARHSVFREHYRRSHSWICLILPSS